MDLGDGVADLHVHTTASDGTSSIAERVERARDQELAAIAPTDHDVIAEGRTSRVSHAGALEVITGVEVRADVDDTKVELLGYYVDPTDEGLQSLLSRVRRFRRERNRAIVERLRRVTALTASYEDIRATAPGILGRPHVAQVLVDAGIVDSIGAAFDEYLAAGAEAFVPMERVPASECIETLQAASGVVSLAHPGRLRTKSIDPVVDSLVASGLDAIEVCYPYDDAPSEGTVGLSVADAAALATEYELLRTGGSDCHGPGSGKFRLGDVRIPREQLAAIRDRAGSRQPL